MDKNGDMKNRVRIQMDKLNLIVVKKSAEEITSRSPNPRWKKEKNTTILFVLGVGMSFPVAGRHCSMARSGRKWFATSL
jgi:hypothetical protein